MTHDSYKKMFDLLSKLMILHGTRQVIESHTDVCQLSYEFDELIFEVDTFLGSIEDPNEQPEPQPAFVRRIKKSLCITCPLKELSKYQSLLDSGQVCRVNTVDYFVTGIHHVGNSDYISVELEAMNELTKLSQEMGLYD